MATVLIPCPHCGTQIHPIASRCKYCRAEVRPTEIARGQVLPTGAPVQAVPLAAHRPRALWPLVLGLTGASALAIGLYVKFAGTAEADPQPLAPTPVERAKPAPEVAPDVDPKPAPKPDVTAAPVAPTTTPDKFAKLAGRWKGTGDQPDVAMKWSADLSLDKLGAVGTKVGTVKYGDTLDCSGELIRMANEGNVLVLHERITKDAGGTCVAEGTIKLSPAGESLAAVWLYANGQQAATGELSR